MYRIEMGAFAWPEIRIALMLNIDPFVVHSYQDHSEQQAFKQSWRPAQVHQTPFIWEYTISPCYSVAAEMPFSPMFGKDLEKGSHKPFNVSKPPPISRIPPLPLAATAATWVGIALGKKNRGVFSCLWSQGEWFYEGNRWWCAVVSKQVVSLIELQSYLGMWYHPFWDRAKFSEPTSTTAGDLSFEENSSPGSFLSWNDDESSSLFFGARCKSLCHRTNGCCPYPPNTKANKFKTKYRIFNKPRKKKRICCRISPRFLYGLRSFQKRNYLENWGNKGLQAEPQGAAEAVSALVPPMDPSFFRACWLRQTFCQEGFTIPSNQSCGRYFGSSHL